MGMRGLGAEVENTYEETARKESSAAKKMKIY